MEFYEGNIFRPPSEANSLILQVTIGCSHNRCTFCYMYKDKKYRERSWEEIEKIVAQAAAYYRPEVVKRIFLADGDALAMQHDKLLALLNLLRETFTYLERVAVYAGPRSILEKSNQQLRELKEAGLGIAYLGLESGHPQILQDIKKGVTLPEMIEAGQKVRQAGIKLSLMVIGGLGGKDLSLEHAKASAQAVNEIHPDYLAVLTLRFYPGTPLTKQVEAGKFQPLATMDFIQELRWFVEDLELKDCIFRTNHASNYLILAGTLNRDKDKLLSEIDRVLTEKDYGSLRPEYLRGL
ncbi:MAG: B12-binding domain-containing radical SAM protein [Thermoanaerobacteraceae bacterium]|nr:B12-binding domain-containing radical SAM protein [Thermoanaerobacteraceae bacterium]